MEKFNSKCRYVTCPNAEYLVCQQHLEKHIDKCYIYSPKNELVKLCDLNFKLCYECCYGKDCNNAQCIDNYDKCAEKFLSEYDGVGWSDAATYSGRDCLYCALECNISNCSHPEIEGYDQCFCDYLTDIVNLAIWEVKHNILQKLTYRPWGERICSAQEIYNLTYTKFSEMKEKYDQLYYSPDPGPGYLESQKNFQDRHKKL